MGAMDTILSWIPSIGDGVAWVTEKITGSLAELFNISITALQSRLISLMVVAFWIYLVVAIISISKKLIKWSIVIMLVILLVSILASIFT